MEAGLVHRRLIAFLAATTAFALVYVTTTVVHLPTLWLDSRTGAWSFGSRPSTAAMGFYGKLLECAAAAALAYALVARRRLAGAMAQPTARAAIAAAGMALVGATFFLFAFYAGDRPAPEPMPPGWPDPACPASLPDPR